MACTAPQYAMFEEQVRGRMDSLRKEEQSLGDSEKFIFDPEFAKRNRIRELGRATTNNGVIEYHAAPFDIDMDSLFESDPPDFFDYVTALIRDEDVVPPVDVMCAEVEYPTAKFTDLENKTGKVEDELFKKLSVSHGSFSVLNPSPSTIRRTKPYTVTYVVSSDEAEIWTNNYLAKSQIQVKSVRIEQAVGPLYMGSNGSQVWYNESVALVPNPYSATPLYDSISIQEVWNGVKMSYWKKDREVVCYLNDRSGHYLYPPSVIASSGGAYFIESTFPLAFKTVVERLPPPHVSFFLTDLPEYELDDELGEVSRREGLYYDVRGEGTYLSRRYRYSHLEWAPFSPVGTVPVDRYTLVPRRAPGSSFHTYQGFEVAMYSKQRNIHVAGPYNTVRRRDVLYIVTDNSAVLAELFAELRVISKVSEMYAADMYPYDPGRVFQLIFSSMDDKNHFLDAKLSMAGRYVFRKVQNYVELDSMLYSTAHLRRGVCFVPQRSEEYPLPGFPSGKMYQTYALTVGQVTRTIFPFIPDSVGQNMPEAPWLTPPSPQIGVRLRKYLIAFPLLSDLRYYYGSIVGKSVSWVNHTRDLAIYHESPVPEPSTTVLDRLSVVVESVSVRDWGDVGVTSAYVMSRMDEVGIDPLKLRHLFSSGVRVVVWKQGTSLPTIEWVSLNNILMTLPGSSDDDQVMNGKLVSDIYRYILSTRVGHMFFDGPLSMLSPMIAFLERNRICIEYDFSLGRLTMFFALIR